MKKTTLTLSTSLLLAGAAQAVVYDIGSNVEPVFDSSLDSLTNTGSVTAWDASDEGAHFKVADNSNFSGVNFSGLGITSWLSERNSGVDFSGANFSGISVTANDANMNLGADLTNSNWSSATISSTQNQPFLDTINVGADFSDATFNWNRSGNINYFRRQAGRGVLNANADFSDTTWNFNLYSNSVGTNFFTGGSGSVSALTASDALTMEGATFTFTGDLTNVNTIAGVFIVNLGESAADLDNGAFYDLGFAERNYAAMGYANAGALQTALDGSGWQAVPEPGTYALLAGCLALSFVMLRRRK